ncbi:PQQ-dependent sugar dehydrogenase [Spirosoma sp. BT702]|uniref:PQQ-dependent sugar dehydrogenase n=1 Tax=Spirosoma profusum TaxID=2771354 RepID=A0A927APG0_9BACT|nr:PQQ-dependent sugar dehydrogenase [Spirosoma profusum]MBD2704399.1 PQQ-dependent sugar dehydrogenase [Spirosoma profusum]
MHNFSSSHQLFSVLIRSILLSTFVAFLIPIFGQVVPPDFKVVEVVSGLTEPTVSVFAPDGRIFVGQSNGQLRVVKNDTLLATPFISLTVNSEGERGLLGIAFDPNFATNQYIYLYYTTPTSGTVTVHNRVSRFTANGDVSVPNSETVILELDPLTSPFPWHNGGSLAFGPDGKLYVSTGDGAISENAQDLDKYLGKILRINSDGSVPTGNPFTTGSAAKRRVWAYGLRNPYNITFQPGTGRLFINDVGAISWEEINDATTGGKNFGWPTAEGNVCSGTVCAGFTSPVYSYPHGSGDGKGCAITGGAFYNPTVPKYPSSYVGNYFFSEFCNGWMNTLDLSGPTVQRSPFMTNTLTGDLSVMVGPDGYIYSLSLSQSKIYKILYLDSCATLMAGSWQNADIWSCGHVPTTTDKAVVGHAVTIANNQPARAFDIQYLAGGQLILTETAKLRVGY